MPILRQNKRAFGLIETLIACAILMIICGALLTINVIITRDIAFAKDRAVAYNLAQEAIESGRQIRDSNLVDGLSLTNWNTFVCNPLSAPALSSPSVSTSGYYIITSGKFSSCYGNSPRIALTQDIKLSGENIQIGGVTYNRKIHFLTSGIDPIVDNSAQITNDNAIRMVVDINWIDHGSSRTASVTELLTNWKRGL